ncbi:MAG: decaprenyl-phosphate phosphoribosyltransferase [Candidatus Omnitrophota bacterium]|nr:decaprenyl-phosphate phosphoribosyltransferase [Candidatus Omnitrophota bacterium]
MKIITQLIFSLRPKHWIKNLLIFLPAVFGQKIFVPSVFLKILSAFIFFSLASSSAYLINDVLDRKKDKAHPLKRLRPIAAGKIRPASAVTLAVILGLGSIYLSWLSDYRLSLAILVYLGFNLLYSFFLKEIVIIDVFCLGAFFLIRLLIGALVVNIALSHWIIMCILLLAIFLGFNKRRQELRLINISGKAHRQVLEHYNEYFIDQMCTVLASSIVVVYSLYTIDNRTVHEFGTSHLLYTVPFVYYGIFRYMYLIHKLVKDGDPTTMLFSDSKMMVNLLLWISMCIAVIYGGI